MKFGPELRLALRRLVPGGWLTLLCAALMSAGCGSNPGASAQHSIADNSRATVENPAVTREGGSPTETGPANASSQSDPAEQPPTATEAGAPAISDSADAIAAAPAADKTSATADKADNPAKTTDGTEPKYEVLINHKEFAKDAATHSLRVTYDDLDLLKVLNMKQAKAEAITLMPDWLKGLEGKRVRIRGFMHPQSVFQEQGIARFVLCRDTGVCCFGPNPTIYYLIEVSMKPGSTTNYIENRPFDVVGTFDIKLSQVPETGEVYQLYHINDAEVISK